MVDCIVVVRFLTRTHLKSKYLALPFRNDLGGFEVRTTVDRRTLLAGLPTCLLSGCLGDVSPSENSTATTDSSETTTPNTTVEPTGPIEPTDAVERVRGGDDSVNIQLAGYDSSKFSEAQFFRATDSTGVPADLSRSQVTSALQLQNALAYFGPEVEEVSVSMPVSDGYSLANALSTYWASADDAERNDNEEEVYRFEDVRFTALVVHYD